MKIDVRLWHVENDFVQLWVIVDYRQVEHSGRVTILRIDKEGIGVYHWYRHKYKTKIYLPMCAEYEKKGINDFERNMLGLASLYKKIYKERCFNIKICENMNDLNLPISI